MEEIKSETNFNPGLSVWHRIINISSADDDVEISWWRPRVLLLLRRRRVVGIPFP